MKKGRTRGFTLIEVTLAIVIGIIMIAGATLIYNQAKTSAGNSRAQAKVVALQQLVEEYAAQNQGIYPDNLGNVQVLWQRKRPDDWNKSPWGGLVGASFTPNGVGGVGSWSSGTVLSTNMLGKIGVTAGAAVPGTFPAAVTAQAASQVGALGYDYDNSNATWQYGPNNGSGDIMTNATKVVKGYAVYIADQQGRFPNFITGGKTN